jgi:rhamnose transport system permease protein
LRAVPVFGTIIGAYAICGALAGFAGLMYASKFGFVNPATAGLGLELMSIAAVVVGGCDIRGGAGTVVGAFLGSVFLSIVFVGLSVLHIEADWQQLVYGAVIIAALWLDALGSKLPRFRGASR